jgi:acetylornithine deacetylase/succinyl-diaminopimelate desuccinylase-like protein
MAMRFEREIQVRASTDRVWAFLWDVPALASWIPGCRDVRAGVAPGKYTAVLAERVGPFQLSFPVSIETRDVVEQTTTVNVGRFYGGVERNVVADGAVAELDLRYPPAVSSEEVRAYLDGILQRLGVPELVMEVAYDYEPFCQSLDAEIVRVARHALREVGVCEDPYPVFKASTNDCRHLKRAGIPSVVLGHDGSGGHVPNEHCGIDELVQTTCLYAAVAHAFLTHPGEK